MAHASFSPTSFLVRINSKLLEKFAQSRGIDFKAKEKGKDEEPEDCGEMADRFIQKLEESGNGKVGEITVELIEVDDMANERACEYLMNRARCAGIEMSKRELDELKNHYDRSLWFYLNHQLLFTETLNEYEIDNITGFKWVKTEIKNKKKVMSKKENLRQAIQDYYKAEYKGQYCMITDYDKDDRICFVVYIEDNYTNDMVFEKGKFNPLKPSKKVFEAFFVYRPAQGILGVKVKGGRPKINNMQELFVEQVLESVFDSEEIAEAFDFDKFKYLNLLNMNVEPTDGVDFVQLKGLRLYDTATKGKIELLTGNSNEPGAEAMQNLVDRLNIDLSHYSVSQAIILVKFKKDKKRGRQKKVTTRLTWPNSCDLKERQEDKKVRELLKRWEIDIL